MAKGTADSNTAAADRPLIAFQGVTRRFGPVTAVADLSLTIAEGEVFCLLGPSGCGKTTLMRMLAGFERPDEGRVFLDGTDLAGVPPHRRPVNMMFQSYALFPHLTVADNVAFGLKQAGLPRADIATRVAELIGLVQLGGLERRKPAQLSGGQKQRVALARSLARRPRVLLLDEPLAALDRRIREETQLELKRIQKELGTTFLIVTHDQHEAMVLSDRIGVMEAGKLLQVGRPDEIYDAPATRAVAAFIGDINFLDGVAAGPGQGGTISVDVAGFPGLLLATAPGGPPVTGPVTVAVRPERCTVSPLGTDAANMIPARIVDVAYRGDASMVLCRTDSGVMLRAAVAEPARRSGLTPGSDVAFSFRPDDARVLTA